MTFMLRAARWEAGTSWRVDQNRAAAVGRLTSSAHAIAYGIKFLASMPLTPWLPAW